jgi:hypothetical protein
MKIDLTAAARAVLLNCGDVGRLCIAKHIRQADRKNCSRRVRAEAEQPNKMRRCGWRSAYR